MRNKRQWLLAGVFAAAALAAGWSFWGKGGAAPKPQEIFQTITADSRHSRTVTWLAPPGSAQRLAYAREGGGESVVLPAKRTELTTGEAAEDAYTVKLEGLCPGAVYRYRVGGEGRWSAWRVLRTEAEGAPGFKAIIFGDSQSQDYGVWAQTAQRAWKENPDAAFFVNLGDLVDIGSHYPQWRAWFAGGKEMMAAIPAAVISGNHENYLPGGAFSPAQLYLQLFHLPENGPARLRGQAYSFDYGDVHFAALDSQEEELAAFEPWLIDDQLPWLIDDLRRTRRKWKVVLTHRSLFENSAAGALTPLGRRLVPIFDRCGADVVFTAHIHTYGRSAPLVGGRAAPSGRRGTVYISAGRSGDQVWEEAQRRNFEIAFDDGLAQPNYLVMEASNHRLRIVNFYQNGQEADAVELVK